MSDDKTMIALFGVEWGASIIGNTFLLFLLFRSRKLHRLASQNFIFNCAVADLASSTINIPFAIDYLILKTGNLEGTVAPAVVHFMLLFLMMLTLHSSLIMMADRLFIVKYPVKYNNVMTIRRARLAIVTMWFSTFLFTLSLSFLRISTDPPLASESTVEYMRRHYKTNGGKFFVLLMMLLIYVALAVLNGMLFKALQKLLKRNLEVTADRKLNLKKKAEKRKIAKSSRTVLMVLITYMFCYFPTLLNAFLRALNVDATMVITKENVRAFITLFSAQVSSMLNPIVFILRSSVLRRLAVKRFKKRRRNVVRDEHELQAIQKRFSAYRVGEPTTAQTQAETNKTP